MQSPLHARDCCIGKGLTGHREFLRPYQAALDALPALRSQLLRYFNATRSDAETLAQKAEGVIASKLAELAKVLELEDKDSMRPRSS